MPGSSTTLGCPDARADASVHVAFRLRNSVGAQDMNLCEAQLLAYAFPYRRFAAALAGVRARLRVDADRYSLIVSDFHRLLLAGLPGALRKIVIATVLSQLPRFKASNDASDSACVLQNELHRAIEWVISNRF
jgi:hypothetical protein